VKILICIIFIILNTSLIYADATNNDINNYDIHKQKLIKRKLLLNSFEKCEEYINNSSVELFLNCNDNKLNKKKVNN
jgi:hypothetical protein